MIKDANLKFPNRRQKMKSVEGIVIHHPLAYWTIQRLHEYFISIGWNGTAYSYYVQQDATVYYGRSAKGTEYVGAHTKGENHRYIGICAEGNFHQDVNGVPAKRISDDQYRKLVSITAAKCREHNLTHKDVFGHYEIPGQSTSCPGKLFSMDKFRMDVRKELMKGDDDLNLSNYQWSVLENQVEGLLEDGVISDQDWLRKIKDRTITASEMIWLNSVVLQRLR
ncbi:peptidoglycan recognition protein family protein [Desertibacillus haloalkaliphilus]|uniref:peptidoglycan recognition protein family protein n=1 Tax=Desertibacillus haloalkaliphilus TaxID=1328930 RepID=UPI001C26689E|nr:peptidoglycan recognition family protein [Desertibacillus haloalkaliphilus]MBU8908477.1 peptidoglycan recognition protein family protein [Desertibacillus haloalkaliphilus]